MTRLLAALALLLPGVAAGQSAWDGVHYGWIVCTDKTEPCPLLWLNPQTGQVERLGLSYPGAITYAPDGCHFENIPKVTLVCTKPSS